MSLDPTIPADDVTIASIPGYIRDVKDYIENQLGGVVTATVELPVAGSIIPIVKNSINLIVLQADDIITVDRMEVSDDANIVVLYFESSTITIKHEASPISDSGKFILSGDPNAPDFPVEVGDSLTLISYNGNWMEMSRSLA